ncbi:MAG: hypothetical protein WCG87_01915 [Bacteroidota bacterium]
MSREIKYRWGSEQLIIELGDRIQPRIKVLFIAEFLVTGGMATVFMLQSRPFSANWMHWVTGIGAACLYLVASYRFLSRILFREKLVLNHSELILIQTSLFVRKTIFYDWSMIGPLHYVGKDSKTDHPLKGQCYDYFGFETQEQLIQSLHQSGNLYFNYGGFPIRFGQGVYSWHAEDVVRMMKLFRGEKLLLAPEWDHMLQENDTI